MADVSRDLPIGNGALLVNFDHNYQLRDIYYPRVGQENHTSGEPCRFGIWVEGRFAWLDDPAWSKDLVYLPDTLVTNVTVSHPDLLVTVTFNDAVDLGRDALFRRVRVQNDGAEREVRLFFHFDWHIYGTEVGDTVMYYPAVKGLVAYKGQRCFAACAMVGDRFGLDGYACGKKDVGGAQGTWRDAEDGELGNNPIEQGSVDMTLALKLGRIPAGQAATAYQWLIAARNFAELQAVADVVTLRGPEAFLERTRSYWAAWVNKEDREFADLSPRVADLYRRCLLVVRTQVDSGGAVLAANDADVVKFARDTYSYMWPRDAALAVYAMDQAGYVDLPRRFFELCARIVTKEGYFRHKYTPAGDPGSERPAWNCRLGDLRHEGVIGAARGAAAEAGLEGPRRRREGRRASHTRHVSIRVRQSIDRDGISVIVVRAAEVGGVDEGGACGIELRHEDVERGATPEGGLDSARCDGEVGRAGLACHVGIRAG